MRNVVAKFKIDGLLPYLIQRINLRFFQGARTAKASNFRILEISVSLDLRDLEQKYFAADCVREPENLLVYRALSASKLVDTFVDVGANCGHVAASVLQLYKTVVLIEPNPKLADLLRSLFSDKTSVKICECAVVDKKAVGVLTLTVPDDSSGLATLGGTALSEQRESVHTYHVRASTLETELAGTPLNNAYVKIDVEGFEANIIESAIDLIKIQRPIVGFEALSVEVAERCVNLFADCAFYCARFDFLENGGALSKSIMGMSKGLISGANIEILKLDTIRNSSLHNFSQIFAVPNEKVVAFESSLIQYSNSIGSCNLYKLKTWSP